MDLQMVSTRTETLERCTQAFLEGLPLTALERYELAGEIAANMDQGDRNPPQEGLRLYTGERIRTRQAANAIFFEESARALILIDSPTVNGVMAMDTARRYLTGKCFTDGCLEGECAHAAVGWLRYLSATDFPDSERRLESGLRQVNSLRDGSGRWKGLAFYYTLLMLCEQDRPAARRELRYAAPACERLLAIQPLDEHYGQHRRSVLERVLCLS